MPAISKLSSLAIQIPSLFTVFQTFPWGQLPSPFHIYYPLCLHYVCLIGRCMSVCARTHLHVSVCVCVSSLCNCLLMHVHPRAYVCFWLRVHFMMCTFFLFLVQESPSGPLGVPVPACQKRLHLLDPLEAGDSQMSLGPSTEWWEEDRKRQMGEGGRGEEEGGEGEETGNWMRGKLKRRWATRICRVAREFETTG